MTSRSIRRTSEERAAAVTGAGGGELRPWREARAATCDAIVRANSRRRTLRLARSTALRGVRGDRRRGDAHRCASPRARHHRAVVRVAAACGGKVSRLLLPRRRGVSVVVASRRPARSARRARARAPTRGRAVADDGAVDAHRARRALIDLRHLARRSSTRRFVLEYDMTPRRRTAYTARLSGVVEFAAVTLPAMR